jgi:hypothetical protein
VKIFNITNHVISWSQILLEKLIVDQLFKTFPTFYGTGKFIGGSGWFSHEPDETSPDFHIPFL